MKLNITRSVPVLSNVSAGAIRSRSDVLLSHALGSVNAMLGVKSSTTQTANDDLGQ